MNIYKLSPNLSFWQSYKLAFVGIVTNNPFTTEIAEDLYEALEVVSLSLLKLIGHILIILTVPISSIFFTRLVQKERKRINESTNNKS